MKKIFGLVALLLTGAFAATSALYLHHERSTQATVEADCQNREICLDKINLAPLGRFNDGTLWHGVTQEKPNVNLTGTLTVTGATVLSNNLTLSLFATGRIPYTTTAGLLTSGTGLTYNGSAFGVTGTAAIIGPSSGSLLGLGASSPVSLNSRSTVLEISAANDASVKLPGIVLRANATSYSTNPAWEILLSNPSGSTTGLNITSGTTNMLTINSAGLVSIPGTLGVTGATTISSTLGVTGVTTATGGLTLGASFVDKTTTITSNTTLTSAHSTIFSSASGGSITLTLPAASGNTGLTYTIYKTDISSAATGGGNTVTVDGNGSETIGGSLTQVLVSNTGNGNLKIICDGSNWQIMSLIDEGTFVFTAVGLTTSPTATGYFTRVFNVVTISIPSMTGTSNSVAFSYTGLPTQFKPTYQHWFNLMRAKDNSTTLNTAVASISSSTSDILLFALPATYSWTAAGTKEISIASDITYSLK
jgi:hypothetical protein